MLPAARHGIRHRHSYHTGETQVEHQGAHDKTPICEIQRTPSAQDDTADLLSLSSTPPSSVAALLTTTPSPTHHSQSSTLNYPRLPPPSFLYPEPIAPRQFYSHIMRRNDKGHGSNALRQHHQTPTPLIAALVFLIIAVAGTWAIIVMFIHWRGTTKGMQSMSQRPQSRSQEKDCGDTWRTWLQRLRPLAARDERYSALNSSADEHALDAINGGRAWAHNLPAYLAASNGDGSPTNPFLVAPDRPLKRIVKPRGSAEWAEQHRAYFSSSSDSRSPAVGSRAPSSSHLLSEAELEDVESEAHEAQGQQVSLPRNVEQGHVGGRVGQSWVDLGLAAVDGAVDRFGATIIKWSDNGGKDETLLLPLSKGKQD